MFGSLMRDLYPLLQEAMKQEPVSDESLLRSIADRLAVLRDYLCSNEYPCSICRSRPAQDKTIGVVTLDWDHECDDMGYKVSSWPVFTSTCQDPEREPYTRRGSSTYNYPQIHVSSGTYPRNHGEQLNRAIEDGDSSTEVDYILGSAQERRRLRDLLGIGEPDPTWR